MLAFEFALVFLRLSGMMEGRHGELHQTVESKGNIEPLYVLHTCG